MFSRILLASDGSDHALGSRGSNGIGAFCREASQAVSRTLRTALCLS